MSASVASSLRPLHCQVCALAPTPPRPPVTPFDDSISREPGPQGVAETVWLFTLVQTPCVRPAGPL